LIFIAPPPTPTQGVPDILRFALPPLPPTITPTATNTALPPPPSQPATGAAETGSSGAWRPAPAGSAPQPKPAQSAPKPEASEKAAPEPPEAMPTRTPRAQASSRDRAPTNARPISNLTPTGAAAGGPGPRSEGTQASKVLMLAGLVAVAAGGSWGFYYFLRPPKD
jgi:hypothetical protein